MYPEHPADFSEREEAGSCSGQWEQAVLSLGQFPSPV